MTALFTSPQTWLSLLTLTAMEIVLGIDNVIFISILSTKLPNPQQGRVRKLGMSLALFLRLGLLGALSWMMGLTAPLFTALGQQVSGRDLVLILGGTFLIGKSAH